MTKARRALVHRALVTGYQQQGPGSYQQDTHITGAQGTGSSQQPGTGGHQQGTQGTGTQAHVATISKACQQQGTGGYQQGTHGTGAQGTGSYQQQGNGGYQQSTCGTGSQGSGGYQQGTHGAGAQGTGNYQQQGTGGEGTQGTGAQGTGHQLPAARHWRLPGKHAGHWFTGLWSLAASSKAPAATSKVCRAVVRAVAVAWAIQVL